MITATSGQFRFFNDHANPTCAVSGAAFMGFITAAPVSCGVARGGVPDAVSEGVEGTAGMGGATGMPLASGVCITIVEGTGF